MSKRQILAILGIWVVIFLFLGFPAQWDRWIAIVTGVLIVFVAYRKAPKPKASANNSFVQNNVAPLDSTIKPQ